MCQGKQRVWAFGHAKNITIIILGTPECCQMSTQSPKPVFAGDSNPTNFLCQVLAGKQNEIKVGNKTSYIMHMVSASYWIRSPPTAWLCGMSKLEIVLCCQASTVWFISQ